jgi:hypothetical protein
VRTARGPIAAAIALLTATALAGCASAGDRGGPDPGLRGEWVLASATDGGGSIALLNQYITLTIAGDTSTTGRSACSDYRARFFGTLSSLWVTATLPRNIDCGTALQQTLELRYIAALNQVRSATVVGGVLDLTAPGVDLHYERALRYPTALLLDREWALQSVAPLNLQTGQKDETVPDQGASLRFSKTGALAVETECASITAHYFQNAGQIVADHIIVKTAPTCSSGHDGAIEDYLVRLVDSAFTFRAIKGEMTLTSNRVGVTLGFAEVDPAPTE